MASRSSSSAALFLSFNLFCFAFASPSHSNPCPPPPSRGRSTLPPRTRSPPRTSTPPTPSTPTTPTSPTTPNAPTSPSTPTTPSTSTPAVPSPSTSSNGTCPRDALKLGVCVNLLGLVNATVGSPPTLPCCSLLQGLAELEAAVCLCTAIRANILGINLNLPISLSLLLNVCGRGVPRGFQCS